MVEYSGTQCIRRTPRHADVKQDPSAIGTHFQHVIKTKLRHGDAITEIHLKPNIQDGDETAVLSAGQQKQAEYEYLPARDGQASPACR